MAIPEPSELLRRIEDGELLAAAVFANVDCDAVLDERDGDAEFEESWLRVHRDIGERWEATKPGQDVVDVVGAVCKAAFLATSRATEQHEIASYVSDDFELLARGAALGVSDTLLDDMWTSYESGVVLGPF